MKKVGIAIIAIIIVAAVCGGYYYLSQNKQNVEDAVEVTEVTKLTTKDMSKDYPKTPREVIKLYNRVIKAYYGEEYTTEEFDKLIDLAREMFDPELEGVNPKEAYMAAVETEIADYKANKRLISQTNVCDSSEVRFITDGDDEIAYVTASYFVKEDKSYSKTFQEYVLRKDENGRWKILCFYKVDGESN